MVSKEAVRQIHFHVTKYNRAGYIALNLPFFTGLVSFFNNMGHRNGPHIESLSVNNLQDGYTRYWFKHFISQLGKSTSKPLLR